ncbi:MAG TPA: cell envelope integrity protein TolA [Thermodesulfobacteriota bacterium]|nr:cell envelope integrity protein TolA [Thermodesulfobacteriota bacterium]
MEYFNRIGSRDFSFWGIVLSLVLHGIIILFIIFRGFQAPEHLNEPQSIEGRLVSLSELEKPAVKGISKKEEVKASQLIEKKSPQEVKKVETKEPPRIVKEPPKVKEEKPEKKETPKKEEKEIPKKVEVKKEEAPVVEEKPKEKDTVALNPKEENQKKQVAEQEEKEQQAAKKPETTKPAEPDSAPSKNDEKGTDFEEKRSKILQDMKKSLVLKDIERNLEEKEVAEASNSESTGDVEPYGSEGSGGGALSSAIIALYVNRIREEIGSNWGTPPNIPMDGSLETLVVFRVDENGKVYDVKVEDSSGNPAFDNFCVQAIYKAAPLTPPPPELREEAKTEGVEVPFRNEAT